MIYNVQSQESGRSYICELEISLRFADWILKLFRLCHVVYYFHFIETICETYVFSYLTGAPGRKGKRGRRGQKGEPGEGGAQGAKGGPGK